MSDHPLATFAVTQIPPPGGYGVAGAPGVVAVRGDLAAIATLAARKGAVAQLIEAAQSALGLALPAGPKAVTAGALTALGTAPDRWLVLSETEAGLADRLRGTFGALTAVTDQSDAYVAFDLEGPRVRDLLAKGIALDLDPSVFGLGDAATTVCAHIGVTLYQREASPAYRFLIARSYEAAFTRFLVASAAEYGFRLDARG